MTKGQVNRRTFMTFNIGHLITILVCVGGFVYGYGELNTRVSNLEITVKDLKQDWKQTADKISMGDMAVNGQMAVMNVKLSTIENDLAWVKKNIK